MIIEQIIPNRKELAMINSIIAFDNIMDRPLGLNEFNEKMTSQLPIRNDRYHVKWSKNAVYCKCNRP